MTATKQSHIPKPPVVARSQEGDPLAVFCGVCMTSCWTLHMFGGGPEAFKACLDAAQVCCGPKTCRECGGAIEHHWCQACRVKHDREKLVAAFAKAKKIPLAEYDGRMVVGDDEEQYVSTEDWDSEGDERHVPHVLDDGTAFVWGTYSERAAVNLMDECADNWLAEHHEDAFDWVDIQKLHEAQKLVDEALAKVNTFHEDTSVAVLVPAPLPCCGEFGTGSGDHGDECEVSPAPRVDSGDASKGDE